MMAPIFYRVTYARQGHAGSLTLLLLLLMSTFLQAQDIGHRLYEAHETYKEPTLTHRRFKHKHIVPLLNSLSGPLAVTQVGESMESRAIYQVRAGTGPTKVLLWSQMHGDEATATMALFDIFNFLQAKNDSFDTLRQTILTNTSLYFVPMLNPDGAERWQRRTLADIDMNRDAVRLQTPEGQLLKRLQQELKPLVGFNLHDQNPRYSVGKTGKQAVVSFLATAYDQERNINDVRKRSMHLIVGMNRVLQQFIPGQVARYDDEFEPRAFGDNIQKWGTTLILIESGGFLNDPEKMKIRQLNFVAILTALKAIAEEAYNQENMAEQVVAQYQAIPENNRPLFDVLIRNVTTTLKGKPVVVDIGINRQEINNKGATDFSYKSTIEDVGDLSTFYGLHEIDATGLNLSPVGVHTSTLDSVADLEKLDLTALSRMGVVGFRVRSAPKDKFPLQPIHLLYKGKLPAQPLALGQISTFLLKKGDEIIYRIVNGFWEDDQLTRKNGVVD